MKRNAISPLRMSLSSTWRSGDGSEVDVWKMLETPELEPVGA
jgi:hypothetical protein